MVTMLVKHGADVNKKTNKGFSALAIAIEFGNIFEFAIHNLEKYEYRIRRSILNLFNLN